MQEDKIEALIVELHEANQVFKAFNVRAKKYNTDAARSNKRFINDLGKSRKSLMEAARS